jgi:hypothetical protein
LPTKKKWENKHLSTPKRSKLIEKARESSTTIAEAWSFKTKLIFY